MTPVVVLVIVALLVGFLCGLSAISARGGPPGRREAQTPSQRPAGGKKRRLSASKLIALAVHRPGLRRGSAVPDHAHRCIAGRHRRGSDGVLPQSEG